MNNNIEAGDVVVCVHLRPRGSFFDRNLSRLKLRGVYRVTLVVPDGLILAEVASDHPSEAWWAGRFRKVQKSSEDFTRQIRACRPKKSKQPA